MAHIHTSAADCVKKREREERTWNCRQSQNATITLFSADLFQCVLHKFVSVCWWGMCTNACVRYQHATRSEAKATQKLQLCHSIRSRNSGEHCERMWFMTCFQHDNGDDDDAVATNAVAAKFKEMCNNVSGRTGVSYLFVSHPPPPSRLISGGRHDKIGLKRAENSARAQETVMHMFVCVMSYVIRLELDWVCAFA